MTQLDLFIDTPEQFAFVLPVIEKATEPKHKPSPDPEIFVDEHLDSQTAAQLLADVQRDRPHVKILRAYHADTFAKMVPTFDDRRTWDTSLRPVSVNKKRIKLFRHQPTCKCCGREANVYVVERDNQRDYVNVYTVSERGTHEMTVDHIVPQSLAGKDTLENRVTMCRSCNQSKASIMTPDEIDLVLSDLTMYVKDWINQDFVHAVFKMHRFYHEGPKQKRRQIITAIQRYASSVSGNWSNDMYNTRIRKINATLNKLSAVQPPAVVVEQPVRLSWKDYVYVWCTTLFNTFSVPA